MSTERSDQYPEVSGEDAGLVPPQGGPKQEWPKKIRTLTANELDRLTIDGLGRFYWDGQLVNYQAHPSRIEKPVDLDQHAMDLLDRTARELDPNAPPPSAETTTTAEANPDTVTTDAPALAATPADQLAPVTPPAVDKATPVVEVRRHEVMVPGGRPARHHPHPADRLAVDWPGDRDRQLPGRGGRHGGLRLRCRARLGLQGRLREARLRARSGHAEAGAASRHPGLISGS